MRGGKTVRATISTVNPKNGEVVFNGDASRRKAYTAAQNDILNDAALQEAADAITAWPGYRPTPLIRLAGLAARAGVASLHYKDEGARFGLGSFKALGGAYAVAQLLRQRIATVKGIAAPEMQEILSGAHANVVSDVTVCCATDGNHGRSVAWGARSFGCNCTIFIHETVSEGRKAAIESYGATVIRTAGNYDDSVREAQRVAAQNGWYVVSDTSYPGYTEVPKFVMQGYELMAKEADEALTQPPTHLFLQTGVGGLAAAVTAYFKRRYGGDRPMVILADPMTSACWVESFRHRQPTAIAGDLETLMAGLACGEVSLLAWEILRDHADAAIAVSDEDAVAMMKALADPAGDPPIVAGESAVAGAAALLRLAGNSDLRARLGLSDASRVLVFGTEADTDPDLYTRLVGRSGDDVRKGLA